MRASRALRSSAISRETWDRGEDHGVQVAHGVDGHLVALVQLLHLPGGDEIPVGGVQAQSAGVQVEGAL